MPAEMLAGVGPVGLGVASVAFVRGNGAELDPEPDGMTPEETGGEPLAPEAAVGAAVEFVSG